MQNTWHFQSKQSQSDLYWRFVTYYKIWQVFPLLPLKNGVKCADFCTFIRAEKTEEKQKHNVLLEPQQRTFLKSTSFTGCVLQIFTYSNFS